MFFPVIEREKSKASEEKLTEVYEHFLKLFMRHSEILNYRTRIYNIIEYYQFDYKKIWSMDISYVLSTVESEDEHKKISQILDNITTQETDYESFDIMNYEYIMHYTNILYNLYSNEVMEKYQHLYSCVDIPKISLGREVNSL